jgi:hypothetical protein
MWEFMSIDRGKLANLLEYPGFSLKVFIVKYKQMQY